METSPSNYRVLFIPLMIFYLGWMKFAAPGYSVYFLDYILRVIVFYLIWVERNALFAKTDWKRPKLWWWFLGFLIFDLVSHRIIYSFDIANDINAYFYETDQYPRIQNLFFLAFDLSIGLLLVAITEEYIFRYKLEQYLGKWQIPLWGRYVLTSVMFSLIHLPQGLITLGQTFLWGLVLFYLYQKTKSLPFVIAAHFVTNFAVFGLYAMGY